MLEGLCDLLSGISEGILHNFLTIGLQSGLEHEGSDFGNQCWCIVNPNVGLPLHDSILRVVAVDSAEVTGESLSFVHGLTTLNPDGKTTPVTFLLTSFEGSLVDSLILVFDFLMVEHHTDGRGAAAHIKVH